MQKNVVNHRLNITYDDFLNMGESINKATVGSYSIEEKIGEGGFGDVYRGVNQETKKDVAVKIINIAKVHQIKNERLRQITLRLIKSEDLLMRICDSPNLVKCYDVYENEDLKLIMIEYCNGGNLENFISKKGRIPQRQAILIFKQILNGIAECHSKMIIHRDLKSQNVMIHDGMFKIADFGFSKQIIIDQNNISPLQAEQFRRAVAKGDVQGGVTVLGTITNMAPEVMTRKPYGLKADIWSAGVILFQMVFGHFPFESRDRTLLIEEIKKCSMWDQKRIAFKGYTASCEMSNFLKEILVIDPVQRIGWRQLKKHPIFESKDQRVPRSAIPDLPLDFSNLEDDVNVLNLSDSSSGLMKKFGITIQLKDSFTIIKRMENRKSAEVPVQKSLFDWTNECLVECLKIELIYNEIILNMETYKMLDFDERQPIELMYLLVNRCFLSISPINSQMCKLDNEQNLFIHQTYRVIKALYDKINKLFIKYDKALKAQEDKFLNKISDFFKSKEELMKTDKYLNGIENYDFKKDEQLLFIQKKYIEDLKKKLQGPEEVRQSVLKYLRCYSSINMIQFKHLEHTDFDTYIQRLL